MNTSHNFVTHKIKQSDNRTSEKRSKLTKKYENNSSSYNQWVWFNLARGGHH